MISIIIPLYNKAHTIVNTLNTVFTQTYQDFEVIIVNDGSTDNGVEIINQNFSDNRIRIINQDNAGVSAARNKGAYESKFPYLVFLDADDEWMPEFLATIVSAIEKFPKAKMYGTAGGGKSYQTQNFTPKIINKYTNKIIEINYFINPDMMPHLGATVISKDIFHQSGGFPIGIKVSEDICLLLKIGLKNNIVYCGIPLHIYVGNVAGQTTAIRKEKKIENRKDEAYVYSLIYDLWLQNGKINRLVPIFLKYKLRHSFLCFLKSNDYESINILSVNLSLEIKQLLKNSFIKYINNPRYKTIMILYILYTKLLWRRYGFPVVGNNASINNIFLNLINNKKTYPL